MRERFANGYHEFVLPFMFGMAFIVVYLLIGAIRIIIHLPASDKKKFFISFINPVAIFKNIKDIIFDVLLHVKIFQRNLLLGYMHASIAFGWFMLIFLGHVETWLYTPHRSGLFYYPVFFRFFVMETEQTLKGSFFFFLMDFFLLIVLSGVFLAMFKRLRSNALGMRKTTKPTLPDLIAMYCLWAVFPIRLLAESFTAGISGGSFLTYPMHWIFSNFLSDTYHIVPTWWAYSSVLGLFFLCMPFSRYMHIPTEAFLIILRNAGIKVKHPRKGYAEAEIYSCSSCGLCLDACPMVTQKKNVQYTSVYFIRFLRRNRDEKAIPIADKCLMCGKCVAVCPVGIESCGLKLAQRSLTKYGINHDYSYLPSPQVEKAKNKVLYFAGCMTQLTPKISNAMTQIMSKAGEKYSFMDENGGICCARPLMLAGNKEAAKKMIEKNREVIASAGAKILLLSCPICYKVFKEDYGLKGIKVMHHSEYINDLIKTDKITLNKGNEKYVYHDPCDLGRGSKIYKDPREVISSIGELVPADKEKKESICCGGSLGSLTLNHQDRNHITDHALSSLYFYKPEKIITACPLCLKTFSPRSKNEVLDLAEIVVKNIKQ